MLIPNYDNLIDKMKNNFKQLYNYMPSKSFRMLISERKWKDECSSSHVIKTSNLL